MDDRIHKWVFDVWFSIQEIEGFLKEYKVESFLDYRSQLVLKRAIERNLEIIGEAIKRIIQQDAFYESHIPQAKSIIGLRNQIIHAYDNISDEIIWSILINHLPKLKAEVGYLLSEERGDKLE
jgi:uncharacterized protein with HEPN domain